MAEKLKLNERPASMDADTDDEIPNAMNQGQAFALITKSFVAIAASLDTFALIAERWALREKLLTMKDLEG